ncbi:hypothetical protein D3C86_2174460 [compost metagenome]
MELKTSSFSIVEIACSVSISSIKIGESIIISSVGISEINKSFSEMSSVEAKVFSV